MTMDVGYEREYPEVRRRRSPFSEDWRWFRSQYGKELEARGITDPDPFDDQGNMSSEAHKAMLDILQQKKTPTEQASTTQLRPIGPTPLTQETVAEAPAYLDPDVWKGRGQRIGAAAQEFFPWIGGPRVIGRLKETREEIRAEEAEGEDIAGWREAIKYGGAVLRPIGQALEAIQETTAPIRGFLTTEVPGLRDPEVQKRFDIHRARGMDQVSALAAAYQQAEEAGEIPLAKSLLLNIGTDPAAIAFPGSSVIGAGLKTTKALFAGKNLDNLIANVHKTHGLKGEVTDAKLEKIRRKVTQRGGQLAEKTVPKEEINKYKKYISTHTGVSIKEVTRITDTGIRPKGFKTSDAARDEIEEIISGMASVDKSESVKAMFVKLKGRQEEIPRKKGAKGARKSRTLSRKELTVLENSLAKATRKTSEEIHDLVEASSADYFTDQWIVERAAANFNPNLLRKAGEWLSSIPMGAAVGRIFTPAALAARSGMEALKEGILYRLLQQNQEARISAKILSLGEEFRKVDFNIDATGHLQLTKTGGKKAFGDVAENASKYLKTKDINEDQYMWITKAKSYIDDLAANYERVSEEKLTYIANYWPRFTTNNLIDDTHISFKKLGSPESPQLARHIQTMQEGIDKGVNYVADPMQVLARYAHSLNKITRDKLFEQRLRKGTITGIGPMVEAPLVGSKLSKAIQGTRKIPDWQSARGWDDLQLSDAAQKQLSQVLGLAKRGGALSKAEAAASIPKLIVAGSFDTGQFFIQGLPLLFYRPTAWVEAVQVSLRTLVSRNPEQFYKQWVHSKLGSEIDNFARYGGDISDISEFFQALGFVRKARVIGPTAARFGAGFHAFMGVGRVKMFSSMDNMIRRHAVRTRMSQTKLDHELSRAARIVDTMMGGTSTKSLGLSATQRQVENAFLFFAPRYTRAVFGSFGHLVGKGYAANEARAIMAQLLGGGALITAGIVGAKATAEGKTQEEAWEEIGNILNPENRRQFMSIKVGNQYFGLAGGYRAAISAIANTLPMTEKSRNRWDEILEDEDPMNQILRNPLVMFARSKSPITTGTVLDFMDNEDFLGRDFTFGSVVTDPSKLTEALLRRTAPIPVQQFIELLGSGHGLPKAAVGGMTEFAGLRHLPATAFEMQRELGSDLLEQAGIVGTAGDIATKRGYEGPGWSEEDLQMDVKDLEVWQLDPRTEYDIENNPEYEAIYAKVREATSEYDPKKAKHLDDRDALREKVFGPEGLLVKAAQRSHTKNPSQPLKYYREQRKTILHDYFVESERLYKESELQKVFGKKKDPTGPFQKAKRIHDQLLYEDDKDTVIEIMGIDESEYIPLEEWNEFNFDERERRMAYLVDTYGQTFIDDLRLVSRSKLPEVERAYREAMDYIAATGYWEVDKFLAREKEVENELAEYRALQRTNESKAKVFLNENDILRVKVINQVGPFRKQMRKADITNGEYRLDNILYKYGYTSVLITDEDPSKRKIYR